MVTHRNTNTAALKLFDKACVPIWNPPFREMHKQLPVHFPTRKCAHGLIRARSPLMGDGLMHIDTDPQVIGIAAYPVTFTYVSGSEKGELSNRELIPDLAILFKDKSTAFVQFNSIKEQRSQPWFDRKVQEVKRHVAEHYDSTFSVMDERGIRAQPRFDNIKVMWANTSLKHDVIDLRSFKAIVRALKLPMKLGDLRAAVAAAPRSRPFAGIAYPQNDLDPTFAAIMQLVMAGELDIDLDRPFSNDTIIRFCNGV